MAFARSDSARPDRLCKAGNIANSFAEICAAAYPPTCATGGENNPDKGRICAFVRKSRSPECEPIIAGTTRSGVRQVWGGEVSFPQRLRSGRSCEFPSAGRCVWSGWNGQPGRSRRQPAAESNARRSFTIECARRARSCRAGRPTERAGGPFHPELHCMVPARCPLFHRMAKELASPNSGNITCLAGTGTRPRCGSELGACRRFFASGC